MRPLDAGRQRSADGQAVAVEHAESLERLAFLAEEHAAVGQHARGGGTSSSGLVSLVATTTDRSAPLQAMMMIDGDSIRTCLLRAALLLLADDGCVVVEAVL